MKPPKTREEIDSEILVVIHGVRLVRGRIELTRGTFWPERDEEYVPPVLGGAP